jgi:hypothetical protein
MKIKTGNFAQGELVWVRPQMGHEEEAEPGVVISKRMGVFPVEVWVEIDGFSKPHTIMTNMYDVLAGGKMLTLSSLLMRSNTSDDSQ